MTRYALGLGSNLGDRASHLRRAVAGLGEAGEVVAVSGLYETEPVGGPEQGPYLNAVVVLDSELDPFALLDLARALESGAGRVREVRWGPRTLDVDIVASDGPEVADPSLQVPHPRAREREFVLRPLVDVWPDAPVGEGSTAAQALAGLPGQGVALVGDPGAWHPPGPGK